MRRFPNPFYVIVGIVGAAFTATVGAFVLAATWDSARNNSTGAAEVASTFWPQVVETLDRHGAVVLGVQLALLAIACFAAMASDKFFAVGGRRSRRPDPASDAAES